MSAPPELLERQRRLKSLITGSDPLYALPVSWLAPPRAQAGLEIYHEAYGLRLTQELSVRFPRCEALLGERFGLAAADYLQRFPSRSPQLQLFGQQFAACLEQFLPAEPWLAGLAAHEWSCFEVLHRQEAPADSYAPLSQGQGRLMLNPTLHLQPSPWRLLDEPPDQAGPVTLLVWKHQGRLCRESRPLAAHALLSALQRGDSLEQACRAVEADTPTETLAAWLTDWFHDWGQQGLVLGFALDPLARASVDLT